MRDRNVVVDAAAVEGRAHGVFAGVAKRRRIVRTVVSLSVGGAAVLGSIFVYRQLLLPLIDLAFHPGPLWLSVFRRAGIFVSAISAYYGYVRLFEKRRPAELRLRPVPLIVGAVGGAALVGIPIAVLFAIHAYQLLGVRGVSASLLGPAALIGIAATLEELVYRCVLFRVVEREWGTRIAMPVQAVLFAFAHVENLTGGSARDVAVMIVSVTLLGVLWAAVFVLTRNLWAAAANHAAWNFTILSSGVPLSGIEDWRALAPFDSRYAGPDWLTGGRFGPESSLLVIVTVALALIMLLRSASRRGMFVETR